MKAVKIFMILREVRYEMILKSKMSWNEIQSPFGEEKPATHKSAIFQPPNAQKSSKKTDLTHQTPKNHILARSAKIEVGVGQSDAKNWVVGQKYDPGNSRRIYKCKFAESGGN